MNKQRIYLTDEDKLIIVTDNGRQEKDGITTEIKGEFIVDDTTAVRLFGLINNQALLYKSITDYEKAALYMPPTCYNIIVDKKDNVDLISQLKKEIDEQNTSYRREIRNYNQELDFLKEQIKQFNESRRWWERKLVIK